MVRVQNVLCSFFVCQILYEKRRCFGISSNVHQINEEIRDSEIRLISATGEQLGIMSAAQAQHIADEQGLDLVKISPQAKPPVCKLMDYGKFRFEQGKREKEARKNQHVVEIKEVRMSPGIDVGDFNTKLKNAQKFIADGNPVSRSLSASAAARWHTRTSAAIFLCALQSPSPRSPTWIKSRKWKAAACRSSFPPRRESNFERHYKYEKEKLLCPS